jgi:hypothetical protein
MALLYIPTQRDDMFHVEQFALSAHFSQKIEAKTSDIRRELRLGEQCKIGTTRGLPVTFWLLVGLLQILTAFIQRALRVVVGLQRLTVFIGRAFPLAGKIENLA